MKNSCCALVAPTKLCISSIINTSISLYLFLNCLIASMLLLPLLFLYISTKSDTKLSQVIYKTFLLLFLILYYLFISKHISLLVIFTLVFCWVGDIVLTKKGNMYFVIGGISFLIAHVLLVFLYSKRIILSDISWGVTLFIMSFYLIAIIFVMKKVKDNLSMKMFIPMTFYLVCNFMMNTFAMMQLQCNRSFGEVILVMTLQIYQIIL